MIHDIKRFFYRIPRGPYLQYKLSEKDNNGNYKKRIDESKNLIENGAEKCYRHDFINAGMAATTILPRAKILNTSINDTSGVDYNLRTQTIGRYNPPKKATISLEDYKLNPKFSSNDAITTFVPGDAAQKQKSQHAGYNSYTLPSTRRECQSIKRSTSNRVHGLVSTTAMPSYITLENALSFEFFHHLSPTQGWALLCQSIQALQDLFLSGELFHIIFIVIVVVEIDNDEIIMALCFFDSPLGRRKK